MKIVHNALVEPFAVKQKCNYVLPSVPQGQQLYSRDVKINYITRSKGIILETGNEEREDEVEEGDRAAETQR